MSYDVDVKWLKCTSWMVTFYETNSTVIFCMSRSGVFCLKFFNKIFSSTATVFSLFFISSAATANC